MAVNAAKQITIIRAAHVLDVRDGRVLADQAILIEGDRIRQVGPAMTITDLGHGAKAIDLGNATQVLLPD
jgi:cytosine/adenosine deaminase-related metal-dependent hydrolase